MTAGIAGVLSDLDRVLLDAGTIQRRVAAMAREIERDSADGELSVVALMDGALFFVADLLRSIDRPVRLHTLTVSSYHGTARSSGRVEIARTLSFPPASRHVLLVDDILDTGLTLDTVRERILAECRPETLRVAVLLRKRRPRTREVPVDYAGFEIDDEFVVGYGMDYQGRYRNLPCIGVLDPGKLPQP